MAQSDPYAAHDAFARPALRRPEPTRVILALIGFEVILGLTGWITFHVLPDDTLYPDTTPIGTALGFASFGIVLFLFHYLIRSLHGRGIETMIGPTHQLWKDGRRALVAVGGVLLALEILMPTFQPNDFVETRNVLAWLVMLPVGIAVILVQCTTEEVVYRGYLQQQVAVATRSRVAYILVPSLAFGVGHYWNGWGPSDGVLYAFWATLLGIACADLTARTGSLGAAIGLHSANNIYATVIFAESQGPTSGLALFLTEPVDRADFDYGLSGLLSIHTFYELAFSSLIVLIMWLAARIAVHR